MLNIEHKISSIFCCLNKRKIELVQSSRFCKLCPLPLCKRFILEQIYIGNSDAVLFREYSLYCCPPGNVCFENGDAMSPWRRMCVCV